MEKIGIRALPAEGVTPKAPAAKARETADNPAVVDKVSLGTSPQPEVKPWTILYYLAGNNDISQDMILKTARLEQAGSNPQVNIAVQMAQPEDSPYPGVTRFKIEKNPNPVKIPDLKAAPGQVYHNGKPVSRQEMPKLVSPPLAKLEDTAMNDPRTLSDFVAWGVKSFPAQHYLVVVMDHGYGFLGTVEDNKQDKILSLPEIKQALTAAQAQTGKQIDILGLDSCLMQQAEAAYELKDNAGYLLASEEVEYPLGMPEGRMAGRLQAALAHAEVSPDEAARLLVQEAGQAPDAIKTMSAIDLRQMEAVKNHADALANSLLKSSMPKAELKKLVEATFNFCRVLPDDKLCTNYRDLRHFAALLEQSPLAEPKVKSAAAALSQTLNSAVVAETHTPEEQASGLSIYLPDNGMLEAYDRRDPGAKAVMSPKEIYGELQWAKHTAWDELLQSLK